MSTEPLEPTSSEKALVESRASMTDTDSLVAEADAVFGFLRAHRQQNHYANKVRQIFQGAT